MTLLLETNKDWADYVTIIANLAFTLTTFVIAIYAAVQARAAKKSADIYEQTVRLTERADVLLDSVGVIEASTSVRDNRVVLKFKNFGRTRGNNLIFYVSLTIPNLPPASPDPSPVTVLAAGDIVTMPFSVFGEWLTRDSFTDIYSGKIEMRFDAKVTYTDIFDVDHSMECGGIFMHKSNTFRLEYNRAS
jgi:hypothetical protein